MLKISNIYHNIILIYFAVHFISAEYNVYWNAPTFQCRNRGVYFNLSQFNIIQNTNDEFAGDKVSYSNVLKKLIDYLLLIIIIINSI